MLIFSISDFHGALEILDKLRKKIKEIQPDVITFTGDVVKGYKRGDEWLNAKKESREPRRDLPEIEAEKEEDFDLYKKFYHALNKLKIPVMTINGNMDAPESRLFDVILNEKFEFINLIQENPYLLENFIFAGCGGEITLKEREDFFVLQFPKEEVKFSLSRLKKIKGGDKEKILLFHSPPIGKIVDLDEGKHKGSKAVNELIQAIKPGIVFCGHAHKAQGKEKISKALVINPGALKYGNYALVDTSEEDNKEVEFGKL
jgi:Icc-related predicted phosphoesterase